MALNRDKLAVRIAAHAGISIGAARKAINGLVEAIPEALMEGERIEIRNFGIWEMKYRPSRIGWSFERGEHIRVEPKYIPTFKFSKQVKKDIEETFVKMFEEGNDDE